MIRQYGSGYFAVGHITTQQRLGRGQRLLALVGTAGACVRGGIVEKGAGILVLVHEQNVIFHDGIGG